MTISSCNRRVQLVAMASFSIAVMVMVLSPEIGWAADEDLTSSVYLVFDPETGEFVTVEDTDRSKQHAEERAGSALHETPPSGTEAPSESSIKSAMPIAGGVAAVVLLGGAIVLVRRKKQKGS